MVHGARSLIKHAHKKEDDSNVWVMALIERHLSASKHYLFFAEAEETIYDYVPREVVQTEGKRFRQMAKLFIYRS
jgi:hypothetical protein